MKRIVLSILSICSLFLFTGNAFAQAYAFIPNSGDDTVSIVDTSDDSVAATINLPEGSSPYAAAVHPDGTYAYIVNTGSGTVTVIDTSEISGLPEDLIETTVTVGSDPRGIAVDPDGDYVYVANYGSDTLSIIDTDSYSVSTSDDEGSGPWGVLADPDGDFVYVANHLEDSLTVISTNTSVTISDIGDGPVDLVHDEDRDLLYVTCSEAGTLAVLEVDYPDEDEDDEDIVVSLDATITVDIAPWGVALSPSNDDIYVSDSSTGSVWIIDAEDYDNIVSLSLDAGLRGITSALNGETMYVAGYETDTVYTIDIETQTETTSIAGFSAPVAMGQFIGGWPPDAPSDLESSDVDEDSVTLEWSDNSWDETGFKIQRKDYGDDDDEYETIATVDANVTEYTNSGLSDDHSYTYQVVAYNEAGDSDPSDSVTITTDTATACFIGLVNRPDRRHPGVQFLSVLGILLLGMVDALSRRSRQWTRPQ